MGKDKVRLTNKQEKFVQELIKGKSQREAYKAAYNCKKMADKTIDEKASRLFSQDKIRARYNKIHDRLLKEAEDECIIDAKMVLKRWRDIAFADPNELIHHRRVCCRHCFGIDHQYQWVDEEEYNRTVESILKNAKEDEEPELPSNDGGYGYDRTIRPHPKCPKCKGEGYGQVFAADTRDLSPEGLALYAGVKQTNSGFEVLMKSQEKSLENIAKYLGMFKETVEHTGKNGGPIETVNIDMSENEKLDLIKRVAARSAAEKEE